jgi:hypothetical protein
LPGTGDRLAALLLLALASCDAPSTVPPSTAVEARDAGADSGGRTGSDAAAPAGVAAAGAPERPVQAQSPVRCGECHRRMYREWNDSAHARSARSPLFRAFQRASGSAECARCHQPLRAAAPAGTPGTGADDGITCDGCHLLKTAQPERGGGRLALAVHDTVRYARRCDARDHYFHRMGCAPQFEESALCGACHLWYLRPAGASAALPIFTEYEEWQRSPAGLQQRHCQSCHMPRDASEVAVGAGQRPDVPHHHLLGSDGRLRKTALAVKVRVERAPATPGGAHEGARPSDLQVTVTLTNIGAGHAVPTGLPGRQVVLSVRTLDPAGQPLDAAEARYGRVLVDAGGAEVPFFRAVRVGRDDRLLPATPRVETFRLRGDNVAEVQVDVQWRSLSPELAQAMQMTPSVLVMASGRVTLAAGGRALPLPRQVMVAP